MSIIAEIRKLDKDSESFSSGSNASHDPVNHPKHYTSGKIEVADFVADQRLNFDRGNAVKYICRAGKKDGSDEIEDLEKAIWYLKHEIKIRQEEKQ